MAMNGGVVEVGLRLNSRNFMAEVSLAARQGAQKLDVLNQRQNTQIGLLKQASGLHKEILSSSNKLSNSAKLKALEEQKILKLAELNLKAANQQLQIEKSLQGVTGTRAKVLRAELEKTLKVTTELSRQKINLDFSKAKADIAESNKLTQLWGKSVQGVGLAVKGLLVATGIGAALLAVGGLVKLISAPISISKGFLDFDRVLADLSAVTGTTRDQMKPLTDEIERLGIVTSKTPTQIADTALGLSRLGFNAQETKDSLEGVARASEATGMSMDAMAETIGTVVKVNGLQAESSIKVADLMVTASNNSAQSAEQMSEAWQKATISGGAYSQTLESQALALAVLADAGLRGELGGTAYENMTKALIEQQTAWEKLGISIYNSQGQMRQMPEIIEDLRNKLQGLNDEQKSSIVGELAPDIRGRRGFLAYLNISVEKVQELDEKLQNAGGNALKAAQVRLDSFSGQVDLLQGSMETFSNRLGKVFEPFARGLIEAVNEIFLGMLKNEDAFTNVQEIGERFLQTVRDNKETLDLIGQTLTTLIAEGLQYAADKLKEWLDYLEKNPEIIAQIKSGLEKVTEEAGNWLDLITRLVETLEMIANGGPVLNALMKGLEMLWEKTESWRQKVAEVVSELFKASEGVTDGTSGRSPEMSASKLKEEWALFEKYAAQIGVDPMWMASLYSFESGGEPTNTSKWGGDGGRYLGPNQFSPDNQRRYGVYPGMPLEEYMQATVQYYKDRGFKPGMTEAQFYATTLAGNPYDVNARDSNGTYAADAVSRRFGPHRQSIMDRYGLTPSADTESEYSRAGNRPESRDRGYTDSSSTSSTSSRTSTSSTSSTTESSSSDQELPKYTVYTPYFYDESPPGSYDFTLDQNGRKDVAVPSMFSGTVTQAGWIDGYGNSVTVKDAETGLSVFFAHLADLAVQAGQEVVRGQTLGTQGSTGNSTGEHIHGRYYDQNGNPILDRDITEPLTRQYIADLEAGTYGGAGADQQIARDTAERARQEAYDQAREARQAAERVRSEANKTQDQARDQEIANSRQLQDQAIELMKAENQGNEYIQTFADILDERNNIYRGYSDQIEDNNRSIRDLQQAIDDEKAKSQYGETPNTEVIAEWEKQIALLQKSNQELSDLRSKDTEILDIRHRQTLELEAQQRALERQAELLQSNFELEAKRRDLALASETDPMKRAEIEMQNRLAEISEQYKEAATELKNSLDESLQVKAGLEALLESNPEDTFLQSALAEVNTELEHTKQLIENLGIGRQIDERLASIDYEQMRQDDLQARTSDINSRFMDAQTVGLNEWDANAVRRRQGTAEIEQWKMEQMAKAQRDWQDGVFQTEAAYLSLLNQIDAVARADLSVLQEQTKTLGETVDDMVTGEFQSLFESLITGTKTVGEAFADFFGNIASQLAKLALNALFGSLFGGGGGILGALFGADGHIPGTSIQAQNAFNGYIPNYAGGNPGGVLAAAIREGQRMPAGASLVMANSSEAILNAGQQRALANRLSAGGNNISNQVNFTIQNTGPDLNASAIQQMKSVIDQQINQKLAREMRSDGMLSRR